MEKLLRLINAGFLPSMSGTDNPFGTPAESEGGGDGMDEEFSYDLPEDTGTRIKEARYAFKVIGLDKSNSQAGNPMWIFTLVGLHGEAGGREFKIYCALTPAALWKLNDTLKALQLGTPGQKTAFKKSDAIGKLVWGDVKDSEYKGRKGSSIEELHTMTDADKVKAEELAKKLAATGNSDVPF